MRGAQLAELLDGDAPGVGEALDLVAGFDAALVDGLARLGGEAASGVAAAAGALDGTPLGVAVGEAVEKVAAGSIAEEQLAALAAGRAALFGAVHDAQLARLDAALGRERAGWDASDAPEPGSEEALSGCRAWLRELAITGWRGVDHDLVSAADQTIETLLAEPGLRRLAVLMDGLAAELRASCPVATMERLPVRRWADLWTRAVLLAHRGPWAAGTETVSGRLLPLGVEIHEHGTAVQVQLHGVLETSGDGTRLIRTSVLAPKVDTIVGAAVWRLLTGYPVLLDALAQRRSIEVTDMVLSGGDLVWQEDQAATGGPADPFATARVLLADAQAPAVHPLDRHPVRIAEPVLLEGYTADGAIWELDGHTLEADVERLPSSGPLTPELVRASSACIGLLRWDGRWTVQPLAVQATVKKKAVEAHNGDWARWPDDPQLVKAQPKTGDAVAVLRERAGRLLRQ